MHVCVHTRTNQRVSGRVHVLVLVCFTTTIQRVSARVHDIAAAPFGILSPHYVYPRLSDGITCIM